MENETEATNEPRRLVLGVSYDEGGGLYSFTAPNGTSAEELAFVMAALIKVLDRDGIIQRDEFQELVHKYLTDPQYEELKGVN